jgi:hypothetical protein
LATRQAYANLGEILTDFFLIINTYGAYLQYPWKKIAGVKFSPGREQLHKHAEGGEGLHATASKRLAIAFQQVLNNHGVGMYTDDVSYIHIFCEKIS